MSSYYYGDEIKTIIKIYFMIDYMDIRSNTKKYIYFDRRKHLRKIKDLNKLNIMKYGKINTCLYNVTKI